MPASNIDRYRDLLGKQLAMNQETWHRLQQHGVTPATSLRLDFTYRAPDQQSAAALKELLCGETDYAVEVKSSGLLRKEWSVHGTTQPTTISPEILDQWVDWMVSAGFERGCEFDGWGAQV